MRGRPHRTNFYPRPPRGGRLLPLAFRPASGRISIHALREEGDAAPPHLPGPAGIFLSTPSARRATPESVNGKNCGEISIHALREEGDAAHRGRSVRPGIHFYPRPPRGGRPRTRRGSPACRQISIHALREEGDPQLRHPACLPAWISIHALREEGDNVNLVVYLAADDISIHALREEGDPLCGLCTVGSTAFLSTPSARRATDSLCAAVMGQLISIHALREEGDWLTWTARMPRGYFYPRPPRGGRPDYINAIEWTDVISIHALREEGDTQHSA